MTFGWINFVTVHAAEMCTYQTYQWNPSQKKALNIRKVRHPYNELSKEQVDPVTGCSICEEDQQNFKLTKDLSIKLCARIAPKVIPSLKELIASGQLINQLVGYRVGMTRGELDSKGNRTQFSNHSFGTAIDINSQQNGLYDNCLTFNRDCRLVKGGEWHPRKPGSLTENSEIVRSFNRIGFQWGGQITGRQKDFMHFSITGY